jgi:hypothetical protein
VLNSSLFYWYLTVYSDCRNLNKREIESFPFDVSGVATPVAKKLSRQVTALMQDIQDNSKTVTMTYKKHGTMTIQCTYPKLSKRLIDRIDQTIADHLGLTDEQADYIANFDAKYRVGESAGD